MRHNEDRLNAALSAQVRYPTDIRTADEPHTKANLLLQVRRAHELGSSAPLRCACVRCSTGAAPVVHAGMAFHARLVQLSCLVNVRTLAEATQSGDL